MKIFGGRLPARARQKGIGLRGLRLADANPLLCALKEAGAIAPACREGLLNKISVWFWLKKKYRILYSIESGNELAGFVGLFNIQNGSAEGSMLILKGHRNAGTGETALRLFLEMLKKCDFLKTIRARTTGDNPAALSLLKKMGFKKVEGAGGEMMFELELR